MMSPPFPHRPWYCRRCKEHKEPGTERTPLLYCVPCTVDMLHETLDGVSVRHRHMQALRWYIHRLEVAADEQSERV